jgi:hypothetical protein
MRRQLPSKVVPFSRVLARIHHPNLRERIAVLSGEIQSKALEHFLGGVFIGANNMKQSLISAATPLCSGSPTPLGGRLCKPQACRESLTTQRFLDSRESRRAQTKAL